MAYLFDGGISGALYSLKETGRKLANGAKEKVEDFMSGFAGHGWKLWKNNEKWKLEVDELLVRNTFTVFELIVSQIRALRGSMAITQGNAKIKHVSTYSEGGTGYYRLEIEDEVNSIREHDLIRCQKGNKLYHVEVASVYQYYINVRMDEFSSGSGGVVSNPPEIGDEIVQFGNTSHDAEYANRHSAIYLHLDDNEPAIDLMTDIYSTDWSDAVKVRVGGNLPGTDGERGFYAVNGKLMFVDEDAQIVSVINPDGSGSFARGKFSWTKDGSPSFSGTIFLRIDNNNVWEVNSAGENIIGDTEGKRIVISPNSTDIKIYDNTSTEVISLEGTHYTTNDFFNGGTTNVTIKNIPYNYSLFSKGEKSETVDVSNAFQITDANSEISIDPSIYLLNTDPSSGSFAKIQLMLYTYEDTQLSQLKTSTLLVEYNIMEGSLTISTNMRAKVPIGYNVLRINSHVKSVDSIPRQVTVEVNKLTTRIIMDGYMSKLFANGIIMGTSNSNLLEFMNTTVGDGIPYFTSHFENPNNGWRIGIDNVFQLKTGMHWGKPSNVIVSGRFSGGDTVRINPQESWDGNMVTGARVQPGRWKITYPTEWRTLGINDDSCICLITPISVGGDMVINVMGITYDMVQFSTVSGNTNPLFYFELRWL